MAANYRHIGGGENRLGRHYSRFSAFWPPQPLPVNHLLCENCRTQGRIGEVGLRPIDLSLYKVRFTAAEAAKLKTIFPQGVCDYSRPGVGQRPPDGTWQAF